MSQFQRLPREIKGLILEFCSYTSAPALASLASVDHELRAIYEYSCRASEPTFLLNVLEAECDVFAELALGVSQLPRFADLEEAQCVLGLDYEEWELPYKHEGPKHLQFAVKLHRGAVRLGRTLSRIYEQNAFNNKWDRNFRQIPDDVLHVVDPRCWTFAVYCMWLGKMLGIEFSPHYIPGYENESDESDRIMERIYCIVPLLGGPHVSYDDYKEFTAAVACLVQYQVPILLSQRSQESSVFESMDMDNRHNPTSKDLESYKEMLAERFE